jgi:hypothetical protein
MGATLHGPYIVMLVLCSLGVTALALLLGRRLTAVQDDPLRTSLVVAASKSAGPADRAGSGEPARTARVP